MLPTKTLITLLNATPFDLGAFTACLASKEGERFSDYLDMYHYLGDGYYNIVIAKQDCLPVYKALARYQTNLSNDDYKRALYALLDYYVASEHPYTVDIVTNIVRVFQGLAQGFPHIDVYQTCWDDIKQYCYSHYLLASSESQQVTLYYKPFQGFKLDVFGEEREAFLIAFGFGVSRHRPLESHVNNLKRDITSLMIDEDGRRSLFSYMAAPELFNWCMGWKNPGAIMQAFVNLASFISINKIRIQWGNALAEQLKDLMLGVFAGDYTIAQEDAPRFFEALKTLEVNLNAVGSSQGGNQVIAGRDLWSLLGEHQPGNIALLAELIKACPESVNEQHQFSVKTLYFRELQKSTSHPLILAARCYLLEPWGRQWFVEIFKAPSLRITPELCKAYFECCRHRKHVLLVEGNAHFTNHPDYAEWVSRIDHQHDKHILHALTHLNTNVKLHSNSCLLRYVLAFSLWGVSYLNKERNDDWVQVSGAKVPYHEFFNHWMIKTEYNESTSWIKQNSPIFGFPNVGTHEDYDDNELYMCDLARAAFRDKFKQDPDRHSLKEAYVQFLVESPELKSAFLEATILGRQCLFSNVLMSHKNDNNLKYTAQYERACVLVRDVAVPLSVIAKLKTKIETEKPSPRDAVLYLGLSDDLSDEMMAEVVQVHLLAGKYDLKTEKDIRNALKLLSDTKYAWLIEKLKDLTTQLLKDGTVQTEQLKMTEKHEACPLTLLLRAGTSSRDDRDTSFYEECILESAPRFNPSRLFKKRSLRPQEVELKEGVLLGRDSRIISQNEDIGAFYAPI